MKVFSFFKKKSTAPVSDVAMDNVINSIFNSKPLYDELKIKCHPDLFIDPNQKEKAQLLFQELQKARHDIDAMKLLKDDIEELYRLR